MKQKKDYQKMLITHKNKFCEVVYKRTENIQHTVFGRITNVKKHSVTLLINDEKKISIGYRKFVNLKLVCIFDVLTHNRKY